MLISVFSPLWFIMFGCDAAIVVGLSILLRKRSADQKAKVMMIIGIQRTACLTHWLSLSCLKEFSSPGFCFAELHASRTLSIPIVSPREGLAFFQTLGSVQSSDSSAP